MRWFICALLLLVGVQTSKAEEADVYYVVSRLNPKMPKIGPLYHASVLICPPGVSPTVKCDDKGWAIKNPSPTCQYFGSLVGYKGFQPERDLWDVKVKKVEVSPDLVRERLAAYDKKWGPIRNCQCAAAYATGQRSVWSLWLKK